MGNNYYHSIIYLPWSETRTADDLITWSGDYINTYKFKMVPSSRPTIASPTVSTNFQSNKLMDGSIDVSLPKFDLGKRTGDWEFYVLNELSDEFKSYDDWQTRFEELLSAFNGRNGMILFCDDTNWCYYGRITFKNWKSEKDYSKVTLHYEAYARRYEFKDSNGNGLDISEQTSNFSTRADLENFLAGIDSDLIIEIVTNPDGTFTVRYFPRGLKDQVGDTGVMQDHDDTDPNAGLTANAMRRTTPVWKWDDLFAGSAEHGAFTIPPTGTIWREIINDNVEDISLFMVGSANCEVYMFYNYKYQPNVSEAIRHITIPASSAAVELVVPARSGFYLYFVGTGTITIARTGGVTL